MYLRALALLTCGALSATVLADDDSVDYSGFKWRNIGPAFMSGRIADIDWDPTDNSVWYVGVGSGGVWKTDNAGVTWSPIFDSQSVYSIGNVTVDPSNPHTVWAGTGEDVGGRHVGFGDGIYRSDDGGKTWANKGLEESQHISTILVHPSDSNTVWAAVHGPLWNKGGERGLFMTEDGGETWTKTLGDDEWTGVSDIVMDPRDPDVLYAATWQHHRTVAAYMGGGPNSGLHKSVDGGRTWQTLSNGLPKGNMGKIGLAISPQNPDIVYAAIELDRREGGVWRSDNRGASWTKGADAVGGGTGPHYYQEIVASPHHFERLYLVGPTVQISHDGGQTFERMRQTHIHGDMHAIVFHPTDPNYIMMGTDGGVYESFDQGENWRYMQNLPLTQYYKLALDDSEPFYNIYGGTQDNNTQGGPSRTDNAQGIRNSDWYVLLGGDGHQPATEPGNPNVIYAQSQQGNIQRIDKETGESVYIKPQPKPGDPAERFNWDSPILVSPHKPSRIYFASQRVWQSEDRGDSWTAISGDLTRNQDRFQLPLMDQTWGWDAPWDMYAMSDYNTITSLAESPLVSGLMYAGTDDGLIHVTEDAGANWRKVEVGSLPGVPDTAFVNDIRADLHDEDTVYVALDNHKYGDFKPYLLVSRNRGKSWKSIADDLPDEHLVWRLVQDHVKPGLMFIGTEFGVFMTQDAGESWDKLSSGMPTISIRDIQIQRRENDLVAASFGRGFFVLDDYSPLRDVSDETLEKEGHLFGARTADWYFPKRVLGYSKKGSQGDQLYVADNPPFGANLTFHLSEGFSTLKSDRQSAEREAKDSDEAISFPSWDEINAELREEKADVMLLIRDQQGNVVRKVDAPESKGFHRVAWDLEYSFKGPIETPNSWRGTPPTGVMGLPGTYTAQVVVSEGGSERALTEPVAFEVERLYEPHLKGNTLEEGMAFNLALGELSGRVSAARYAMRDAKSDIGKMEKMISRMSVDMPKVGAQLSALKAELAEINETLYGNDAREMLGGYGQHTVSSWLSHAMWGVSSSSYGPTASHRDSFSFAQMLFEPIQARLNVITREEIPELKATLEANGAPWTLGQPIGN